MNKIANRQAICDELLKLAEKDKDIVVLTSDSRGSASMSPFFEKYPDQCVEVGIAEQNLVSIAAGLAHGGKKPFVFSPASFLSTRSYEQIKIDVAYSDTNVKLIGISGGISYGALGMSHHSAQDIAAISAIPNMRVYLPSDRFQTAELIKQLVNDDKGAYIRIGRNPVEDVYDENYHLQLDKMTEHFFGEGKRTVTIVACGEMVSPSLQAARLLDNAGVKTVVLDACNIKPFDQDTLLKHAEESELVVSVEEHSPYGGLGSIVASVISRNCPRKVVQLALPDEPVVSGKSQEVFAYYGLNAEGICRTVLSELNMENI